MAPTLRDSLLVSNEARSNDGFIAAIVALAASIGFIFVIIQCGCCKRRKKKTAVRSRSVSPPEEGSPKAIEQQENEGAEAVGDTGDRNAKKVKRRKKRHNKKRKRGKLPPAQHVIDAPTPCGKTLPFVSVKEPDPAVGSTIPEAAKTAHGVSVPIAGPHYYEMPVAKDTVKVTTARLQPVDHAVSNYRTFYNVPEDFKTSKAAKTAVIDGRTSNYRTFYNIPEEFQPTRVAKTATVGDTGSSAPGAALPDFLTVNPPNVVLVTDLKPRIEDAKRDQRNIPSMKVISRQKIAIPSRLV